jgi:hypothetical protein
MVGKGVIEGLGNGLGVAVGLLLTGGGREETAVLLLAASVAALATVTSVSDQAPAVEAGPCWQAVNRKKSNTGQHKSVESVRQIDQCSIANV